MSTITRPAPALAALRPAAAPTVAPARGVAPRAGAAAPICPAGGATGAGWRGVTGFRAAKP